MPLKRLDDDHRVSTYRGVELWMVDEEGKLVFCKVSHTALPMSLIVVTAVFAPKIIRAAWEAYWERREEKVKGRLKR